MSKLSSPWILLFAALLLSSLILMASATGSNEIYENRGIKSVNGEKRPFFVGSRYGRSQSDLSHMDENGKSMARIVPRNDRFFIGSRYGKRSSLVTGYDEDQNQSLACLYTGITNLFRCVEKADLSIDSLNEK